MSVPSAETEVIFSQPQFTGPERALSPPECGPYQLSRQEEDCGCGMLKGVITAGFNLIRRQV